jgi:hypothetical protein
MQRPPPAPSQSRQRPKRFVPVPEQVVQRCLPRPLHPEQTFGDPLQTLQRPLPSQDRHTVMPRPPQERHAPGGRLDGTGRRSGAGGAGAEARILEICT